VADYLVKSDLGGYMTKSIRKTVQILVGLVLSLTLAACSEDYGVDQHGQVVTAKALGGQWLVINYWAQWCAPCRTEIPELNALDEQLKSRNVAVLGVNFDALQGDKLAAAAEEMGVTFTVLASDPAQRFQLPRAEVLPVTYIVDDHGSIRETLFGEQTAAGLTARLDQLMAKD
jgi:peroxiredoxin